MEDNLTVAKCPNCGNICHGILGEDFKCIECEFIFNPKDQTFDQETEEEFEERMAVPGDFE